jgi:enoyl-CoA hydratase
MIAYDDFLHLAILVDDGIAVVRFTPKDEGDLERSIFLELRDVFSPLGLDREVQAVVLTGGGEPFFAGGGNKRTAMLLQTDLETMAAQILTQQQALAQILSFRKPLVAAINGPAHNFGAQTAFLCDAAVAASTATFGDDHLALGVAAGDGGTMLWPLLVGMPRARQILLRGRRLSAAEALELDLVDEVVEPGQVLPAGIALAKRLAGLPRLPYFATKLALSNWWRLSGILSHDLALAYETANVFEPEFRGHTEGAV